MSKYIFITGGVVSGLGKGITAASLGRLLKCRGLKVAAQKLDPYLNIDPGTMSPFQHGEVFVTEDGAETDLDLGHYERFIDENLNKFSNLTSGKVYWNVLNKERNGEYLGKTVQIIPHVTDEIKNMIYNVEKTTNPDIIITEIGGTIGDIESQPFIEAIRQISYEIGKENCLFIHITLVPFIECSKEYKTKPTQHSVKELQSLGISPNIIITRTDGEIDEDIKNKIALFCNVKSDCIINNTTLPILYECPIMLHNNGLDNIVCRELNLTTKEIDLTEWNTMLDKIRNRKHTTKIAIVGKYVKLHDAYLSVVESLYHAGYECGTKIEIEWVDCEKITSLEVAKQTFKECNGILIPGGFGDRGIEGKVVTAQYARTSKVPYLGICLGMQIAVIEYARNVCNLENANSKEFSTLNENLVIDLLPNQKDKPKGASMRLGSYPCKIKENTLMHSLYQSDLITERHRHRYEFNNNFRYIFEKNNLTICGTSPDDNIVEAIEIKDHPFYIGVQFHPEFKSRPNKAHPLFIGFIKNSLAK